MKNKLNMENEKLSGDSPHPRESTLANVLQEVIDECTVCGSPTLGLIDKANAALDAYKAEAPHQPSQLRREILLEAIKVNCEECRLGLPVVSHNGYDWHTRQIGMLGPWTPCNSAEIRQLLKAEHSEPAKEKV